jgi:hypothetical protein
MSRDEISYTIAHEMIDDYGPTKAEDYAGSSSRAHVRIGATRATHRDSARQDVQKIQKDTLVSASKVC